MHRERERASVQKGQLWQIFMATLEIIIQSVGTDLKSNSTATAPKF